MALTEISVLWLTAGLSCDGDTIVAPEVLGVSARTGAGMPEYLELLEAGLAAARGTAAVGGAR